MRLLWIGVLVALVGCPTTGPVTPPVDRSPLYAHVTLYDVLPDSRADFEEAIKAATGEMEKQPGFLNNRLLQNLDPIIPRYATYTRFTDQAAAERLTAERIRKVTPFLRRAPEQHLVKITHVYTPQAVSDDATGSEIDPKRSGQIAHLGVFVPFPEYRDTYEDALHKVKLVTRDRQPDGYIGDEIGVGLTDVRLPYSPKPYEPTPVSLNYGEYDSVQHAEDSYVRRAQDRDDDPQIHTLSRVFYSSLQVPTRFYLFRVVE